MRSSKARLKSDSSTITVKFTIIHNITHRPGPLHVSKCQTHGGRELWHSSNTVKVEKTLVFLKGVTFVLHFFQRVSLREVVYWYLQAENNTFLSWMINVAIQGFSQGLLRFTLNSSILSEVSWASTKSPLERLNLRFLLLSQVKRLSDPQKGFSFCRHAHNIPVIVLFWKW